MVVVAVSCFAITGCYSFVMFLSFAGLILKGICQYPDPCIHASKLYILIVQFIVCVHVNMITLIDREVLELSPSLYGLSTHDNRMHNIKGLLHTNVSAASTSDLVDQLEHIYCGTLAAQFQHISVSCFFNQCKLSVGYFVINVKLALVLSCMHIAWHGSQRQGTQQSHVRSIAAESCQVHRHRVMSGPSPQSHVRSIATESCQVHHNRVMQSCSLKNQNIKINLQGSI